MMDFRTPGIGGFKDHIQRFVVSISNNIAEGFDRLSDRKFIRFLLLCNCILQRGEINALSF